MSSLGMTYRDNTVELPFSPAGGYSLVGASYTITDLSITNGQDPDHKNTVGQTKSWAGSNGSISFQVGRKGSSAVADWWKSKIPGSQTTFDHDPGVLNFAFIGTMTLRLRGGILGNNEDVYTIAGVGIGQGHAGSSNNWWFGGTTGQNTGNNTVRLTGKSTSNYTAKFYFRRGGNGVNVINLTEINYPAFRMFGLRSEYLGESTADTWQKTKGGAAKCPPYVIYYNPTQSATLKITVRGGLLYDSAGELFDTAGADLSHSNIPVAIFVVDSNGNLYASYQFKVFLFHHSTILAGASVASAGELQASKGVITFMSNLSGHYRPDATVAHLQLTEALYRQGYHKAIPLPVGDEIVAMGNSKPRIFTLALLIVSQIMIIDYAISYMSGTATGVLVSSFHTSLGAEVAMYSRISVSVNKILGCCAGIRGIGPTDFKGLSGYKGWQGNVKLYGSADLFR
ncbi:hypothetical protein R1flu_017439 [Riccia fluitans]|uniref:Uncharacterized protein n=1 Tax=Riccia fluitans TaxID=41844 RepID=A0ABD1ZFD3_9MARC